MFNQDFDMGQKSHGFDSFAPNTLRSSLMPHVTRNSKEAKPIKAPVAKRDPQMGQKYIMALNYIII